MRAPRVYLSLHRNRDGTTLTLFDERTKTEVTLPAFLGPELLRDRIPREVIRQMALVQRSWAPDRGSITVWVESPPNIHRWLTESTVGHLAAKAASARKSVEFVSVEKEGSAGEDEFLSSPRFHQVSRCTELALHDWREQGRSGKVSCTFCSASYDRVRFDGSPAATLISSVVDSHVWKLGNPRYYGRFQKPDLSPGGLPLRFMVDVQAIHRHHPQEGHDVDYLLASAESHVLELVTVASANLLPGVTELQLGTNKDVEGETHRYIEVSTAEFTERRDLGTLSQLHELARKWGGGEAGMWRALLVAAARVTSHALITTDEVLLQAKPNGGDASVLTPREAVLIAGIRLRYADRVPVPQPDARIHIVMRASHFYQARPLAVAPSFAHFFAATLAGIEEGRFPERTTRLVWAFLARLSLLAEAEDRLAFLWHFPQERSSADDETWYHLEFLLMLAQALLDGLKLLAAEVLGIPEHKVIRWRNFVDELGATSELRRFVRSPAGKSVLEIVRALRRPLAHSEHWRGTSHIGGSEDPTLVSQIIEGESAVEVPRAIARLREKPEEWGIRNPTYDIDEPEIDLQGYPFGVSLNVRLLWFAREFLKHLQLEKNVDPAKIARLRRDPWELTNPPFSHEAHEVVRMLSWPIPH